MIYIVVAIFLLFSFIRVLNIPLTSPPAIFSVIWSVFIFFSYLILSERYPFTFYGITWIFCSCFLLSLGYAFRIETKSTKTKEMESSVNSANISWSLLAVFIFLGLTGFILSAAKYGVSLNVFSDFDSLQSTSNSIAEQRYSGSSVGSSTLEQILNSFVYVLPLCGGYSLVYANSVRKKILIILTAVPSLLSMLLTSAKLAVVAYTILFFVSYYVSYLYLNKKFISINYRKIFQSLFLGYILYQLFYLSFLLRIGSTSASISRIIVTKLGIYAFGHVQAFDLWLPIYMSSDAELGFGGNTFLAFSSLIGVLDKKQGIYELISGSSTNVFTQFRSLISDFGILFGLLVIFILGIVLRIFYKNVINYSSKLIVLQQVLFISILFYLIYFIVSPWVYLTFVLTFFIFYFYLVVAFHFRIKIKFR
uniref:Wzy n=1 Tax=Streptococcus suis TaxID=1307 RepID=A0A1C9IEA0_STRSU|nr:Wzy [Streptococcus suis]